MPGRVNGTDTIFLINKADILVDLWKDVTYGRIVFSYRPEKSDPNRTRLTVGGDRVNYNGDCGTPTADLLTVKLFLNSTISTLGARFMTLDIKYFYLMTPMERYEYMRLKLANLPEDVTKQHKLRERVTKDGYIYLEIRHIMYVLLQAGMIAQKQLEKRLNAVGYRKSSLTPGFWTHTNRPIYFTP